MGPFERVKIQGSPPPWGAVLIDKFVASALQRAANEGGALPEHFCLSLCPWGERNNIGGPAAEMNDLFDPRFRLVHFTSCGRPYLVALLIGEDAQARQQQVMRHLPWSEHYLVELQPDQIVLEFIGETEEPLEEVPDGRDLRTLKELFGSGQLGHF